MIAYLVTTFCNIQTTYAQTSAIIQAQTYYDLEQYQEALDAFEQLYKKDKTANVYTGYLKTLLALKEYKKAEKLVNDQLKRNPHSPVYTLDMGNVFKAWGKTKKGNEFFEIAISLLNGDDMITQMVANKFVALKEDEYALMAYERAGEILRNKNFYSGPMSDLYFKKGDIDNGIDALLRTNRNYFHNGINDVKTTLLEYLGDDKKKLAKAQKAILKKINEQPENPYYSELLVWLYTQKNDWEGALIQVRALDMRYKEQGERLLSFARYAVKEQKENFALTVYDEILERGKEYPLYTSVLNEKLSVQFRIVEDNPKRSKADIKKLAKDYQQLLDSFPEFYGMQPLQDYAKLEAQYADDPEKAIQLLERAIKTPNTRRPFVAECKLMMGDYLILTNKIWDASLVYSQVQKEFREDILGEEARYRNAKLAYYRADFDWANIQLNVLKASTSELIANDALYLSVLITENIPPDSNYTALERFAQADLLMFQNKDEEAETMLEDITTSFPDHPLQDDIFMQRAKLAQKHGDYETAIKHLQQILATHKDDVLADDALFTMAKIYESYLNNKDEAGKRYTQLILEYPGSTYVQLARKKVKELNADMSL